MVSTKKKNKPKFNVMNYGFMKSVKARWRKPRGVDNKKRIRKAFTGASPRVGYRNPFSIRELHPLGKREILVSNVSGLANAKDSLVRIASAVGGKKRMQIIAKAKEMGLIVLNAPQSTESRVQDPKLKTGNDKS